MIHLQQTGPSRALPLLVVVLFVLCLVGCGGGGSGSGSSQPTPPAPTPTPTPDPGGPTETGDSSSARFHVDVASGTVTALPSTNDVGTSAVLTGTAVGFRTTKLVDEGGSVGVKATSVQIENHTGRDLTNAKVVFSDITNVTAVTDIRGLVNVSTMI